MRSDPKGFSEVSAPLTAEAQELYDGSGSFWVRDEREGPIAVKDRRLGTDRRRSRQRTVFVSDVSYATVYLVRNALAGIERATCSTDRLAVRTASCGSRRERFAARRVGEHVSSDVSLCTSYQS